MIALYAVGRGSISYRVIPKTWKWYTLFPCLAFRISGKSMGVKHTVLPDGQPPTVPLIVLAQLCGPKANESEHPLADSQRMVREVTSTLTHGSFLCSWDGGWGIARSYRPPNGEAMYTSCKLLHWPAILFFPYLNLLRRVAPFSISWFPRGHLTRTLAIMSHHNNADITTQCSIPRPTLQPAIFLFLFL